MQAHVADPRAEGKAVTVSCGTLVDTGLFAGKTVAWVRGHLGTLLQIPAGAVAILADGKIVPKAEEAVTLIQQGSLEFVAPTGVKG